MSHDLSCDMQDVHVVVEHSYSVRKFVYREKPVVDENGHGYPCVNSGMWVCKCMYVSI